MIVSTCLLYLRFMAESQNSLSPTTSSSSSSSVNQQQEPPQLRLMGTDRSLGSSVRWASPASISPSNVHAAHAHGFRPSASFHSQSQLRSGYGEPMKSPLGQSGRA